MSEFLKTISPAIISLVIAALGYLVAYLERRKLAIKVDSLEKIFDGGVRHVLSLRPTSALLSQR